MKTKNIQLTAAQAARMYPKAAADFKALLEANFTKDELSSDITDRVKSYEDACEEIGIVPTNEPEMLRAGFRQDEIDRRKIEVITAALNEGTVMDWFDTAQQKWFPWFDTSSGFVDDDANWTNTGANAGSASRLCFKTQALAIYAGKQFTGLYESFMTK